MSETVAELERLCGVTLDIRYRSERHPEGLEGDTVLSLSINSTLRRALETLCNELDDGGSRIAWQVLENGAVEIAVEED